MICLNYPLLAAGLPEPPDDLEGRVGLARSGGHDEQDARDALGDGLDRGVDGIDLVVARRLAAAIVEVILQDDRFRLGVQSLPAAITGPQLLWGGKGIQAEERFRHVARAGAIVENEAVAVGGEDEGNVQRFGIVQGLLHAVADAVVVVLGFDEPQGMFGLK